MLPFLNCPVSCLFHSALQTYTVRVSPTPLLSSHLVPVSAKTRLVSLPSDLSLDYLACLFYLPASLSIVPFVSRQYRLSHDRPSVSRPSRLSLDHPRVSTATFLYSSPGFSNDPVSLEPPEPRREHGSGSRGYSTFLSQSNCLSLTGLVNRGPVETFPSDVHLRS